METLDHRVILEHRFALLNPIRVPSSRTAPMVTQPLVPAGWDRHMRLMPRLVDLDLLDHGQRLALLDRQTLWMQQHDGAYFSALLQSGADLQRVRSHLLRMMIISVAGRESWLRLHDARVFKHLAWMLSPAQLARLMGPVEVWTWFDEHDQRWQSTSRPEMDEETLQQLDRQALADISLIEAINVAVRDDLRAGLSAPDAEALRALLQAGHLAGRYGIDDLHDVAYFMRLSMKYGEALVHMPAFTRCLEYFHAGHGSFVGACTRDDASPLKFVEDGAFEREHALESIDE